VAPLTVSGLVIGLGLLIALNASGVRPSLWTVGIGHVTLNLPLAFAILYAATGPAQLALERAARDLGAREWQVVPLVTARTLAPALAASFCLCVTLSWDEFIVAFLLSRFDVTLPVEIWSELRSGLSPKSNAVGSLVFLISIVAVLVAELLLLRRARR
jgi:spermidine/putrescine transport system permease protein